MGWILRDGAVNDKIAPAKLTLFMTSLAGGGAERVMLYLAQGLVDCGYEVELVVTRAKGAYAASVPSSVRVVDLGCNRIAAALLPLVKYLRRERPQVVLSSLAPTNCMLVVARSLARVSTRVALVEHSTPSRKAGGSMRSKLLPTLMRITYPLADAVVAVSEGVADDLTRTIRLNREQIRVIYNPVVTSEMLELASEPVDHPWFREHKQPVLLAVGRLTEDKDYPTMLRAFRKLRAYRPVRLMILGEGGQRGALEALARKLEIEDDVAMPGFMSNPFAYMRASDVFVLSSCCEGFGMVLVEALACGAKVVSTDCPSGPAEVLGNGAWGRLVPVGDVDALASAIDVTLQSPAVDGVERAREFTVSRAVAEYLDVLANV